MPTYVVPNGYVTCPEEVWEELQKKRHTISPEEAAKLLGTSPMTIRRGMEEGSLDIGVVIRGKKRNRYIITVEKFYAATGIQVE